MNQRLRNVLNGTGSNYIFPFFWQHGEEEAVLRGYMDSIHRANIGAVCIESRPHPDYCGPLWWRDMDIILDEARKRGMKVWILDDSHFPTGYANDAMKLKPDYLCRRSITCKVIDCPDNNTIILSKNELAHPTPLPESEIEKITNQQFPKRETRQFNDDRLIAVIAAKTARARNGVVGEDAFIDLTKKVRDLRLEWKAPDGGWKIYVLHVSGNAGYNRTYINMMDRDSCHVLIEAVYEPHYAHYKDDFGKTIAGFFSDEPELGNGRIYVQGNLLGTDQDLPWSRELEDRLRKKWGNCFAVRLPLLWEANIENKLAAFVRLDYMNEVTRLVEANFSNQIGLWCRDHGVEYTGHIIEDNNQHARTGSSLGHYFRSMTGQDMAGIDEIGDQVTPGGEDSVVTGRVFGNRDGEFFHYVLGKLCSSYAAIDPIKKGRAMCEIFGAGGWKEGVRLEKYLLDHFLTRGINRYVPHAFSPAPFPDPDCPPHFYAHGNNPQYRHFGALMAYLNRVCELIDGGFHGAPVAVLYHAEAEWLSIREGGYMLMQKPCHILADNQIEYDIIPQDIFTEVERYKTKIGKTLCVNTQEYRVLVVPYTRYITEEFADALETMRKAGFPAIFIDALPENGISGFLVTPLDKLPELLRENGIDEIRFYPANNRLRYLRYLHNDGSTVYIFNNEGNKPYYGEVSVPESLPCAIYNAWDNRLEKPQASVENGKTRLTVELEPLKALIVIFDNALADETQTGLIKEPLSCRGKDFQLNNGWTRSLCNGKEYPVFSGNCEVSLPDSLAYEKPTFSGFARYENTFYINHDVEGKFSPNTILEITDAHEGIEVFVNGTSTGIQVVPPFRFDISALVHPGKNALVIEVATTLERQVGPLGPMMEQDKEPVSLSGITGQVNLYQKNNSDHKKTTGGKT
jgi:hypothetical protein